MLRTAFAMALLASSLHGSVAAGPAGAAGLAGRLVVSIGDSVASGEGNPDSLSRPWLETRCHRSLRSGHALAARALDRGDPHTGVDFVPLGCSGATIDKGLLREYRGIQPNRRRGPLPPQLDQLRDLAPGRQVGAVLVSVGANDVHFGPLVAFCVAVPDCYDRRFDPRHPLRESPDRAAPTASQVVAAALQRLPDGYDRLAARLRERVLPDQVVIVEYFDSLGDANGETCERALPRVSRREAEWARRHLLAPLNAQIHAAAARHGWQVVGGVAQGFARHGVCARRASWVHSPPSALARLAPSGLLHPNRAGHAATAGLIAPVLARALGSDPATGAAELAAGDDGGEVPWLWLLVAAALGALFGAFALRRITRLVDWLGRSAVAPLFSFLVSHRLRWAILAALAAAGLGAAAFLVGLSWWRLPLAAGAIACALLYPVAWRRARSWPPNSSLPRKAGRMLVLVALSVLGLAGFVVGAAVWIGHWLEDDVAAVSRGWMYLGVFAGLLLAAWLGHWWASRAQDIFELNRARKWRRRGVSALAALLLAGGALGFLAQQKIPNERMPDEISRQAVMGRYDLVLVVDPADPLSRQLVRSAWRHVRGRRASLLFPAPSPNVGYDVAYGIAVVRAPRGRRALWQLAEPPTTSRAELAEGLARLRHARPRRLASASYGRLLVDALDDERIPWREGSQRGIALVVDQLPSVAALDRRAGPGEGRVPSSDPPAKICPRLLTRRAAPDVPTERSAAVPWSDALALHCARWTRQQAWEADDRIAGIPAPRAPVALHVLSRDIRDSRTRPWSGWSQALDGRLLPAPVNKGRRLDAPELLRNARDLHTGVPAGRLRGLVEKYRPHLRFDSEEKFFPVDVDALFREGDHRHCDRRFPDDNCEPLKEHEDLVGSLDEFIDFAGGARLGRDLWGRGGTARMYVHTLERRGKLYLGYWWFMRFNGSPFRAEVNCLPGLTFKGASCHDHEGDWEGATVVLDLIAPGALPDPYTPLNVAPESALYDSHGKAIRWSWRDVELVAGGPDDDPTHPVVYVAAGSHASYPAACRRSCRQGLGRHPKRPDGRFDGGKAWPYNDRETCAAHQIGRDGDWVGNCLVGLPSTRDGRLGMMWNAFRGAWGNALCTRIAKVCSQVDGPRSPSLQTRFEKPGSAVPGDVERLNRARAAG